ncbi:hypothetical protein CYMTET_36360, partial [Cymbomonas tetramitiformis]
MLLSAAKRPDSSEIPEALGAWMTEAGWSWAALLQKLPVFKNLQDMMEAEPSSWEDWLMGPNPENSSPPALDTTMIQRLLLLRVLRPDRMGHAMADYVSSELGEMYLEQEPFSMTETYKESGPGIPVLFILFPGVSAVKDVEALAGIHGFTAEKGTLHHISMGQGQEKGAEACLDRFTERGGWIFLDNVHLMTRWLPVLERKLEVAAEVGHEHFRCFLSAEPASDPQCVVIPAAIIQNCVKVANEPPQNLKSNLRRAYANFTPDTLATCQKVNQFKTALFALCFFHSLVLGRRRFGFQGWSRPYSFNTGDLKVCADVLRNYLDASLIVPWDDLRYIFGEIMYGGHITDRWDRRTCSAYLQELLQPGLLEGMELAPRFTCPLADGREYADYKAYIEDFLPEENPTLFRMHPNAELRLLTQEAETLFSTISQLQGSIGGSAGAAGTAGGTASREDTVMLVLLELLDGIPPNLSSALCKEEKTPYICIVLQ